jgi:hypothetical protein
VHVSHWDVWKPRSRAEFSVSRIDAQQFWCVDGNYAPTWNDEIRMEMVPDGKTAISLARVVWQAHHPSPRRNDEYWQRAFRAMPNKGVWVVKERSGRRTFLIAKRDGQFMDTSFATAAP